MIFSTFISLLTCFNPKQGPLQVSLHFELFYVKFSFTDSDEAQNEACNVCNKRFKQYRF